MSKTIIVEFVNGKICEYEVVESGCDDHKLAMKLVDKRECVIPLLNVISILRSGE